MRPNARRRPNTSERARRKHRPDYWLPLIATGLLAIGLVVVYAISPGVSVLKGVSEAYYVSKQLLAIGLGIVAFIVLSRIPYGWWRRVVTPLIIASVIAAIAVALFGTKVNGAYRWVQIGGISFQAAELIKFSLLIWLADLLAMRKQAGELNNERTTLKPIVTAIVAVGVVVAGLQSDFGSTVVMMGMIGTMIFVAGVPLKKIATIGAIIAIGSLLLVSTTPYRRERLKSFFSPSANCQSTGYQSCQALIAVGSGGMFGLGLGHSIQAYGYLPEAANDSIFAILAEKFGFVGMSLVLGAYAVFFGRLNRIAERAPDDFSRFLVTGILAWFSVQAVINIGAMLGLLPLKGITLPFISYGGTSLLFVTGALGLAFQISRYALFAADTNQGGDRDEDSPYRRGSGGHITPLLAVAHELKQLNPDIELIAVTETGGKFTYLFEQDKAISAVHQVRAGKLRRYSGEHFFKKITDFKTIFLNIRDVFYTLKGLSQAKKLLRSLHPDGIIMKGGSVCVPMGRAAASLKIPYLTHDSDSVPGLTNRLISKKALLHATGMPVEYYSYPKDRTFYTGVPVSTEFTEVSPKLRAKYREEVGLEDCQPVLTIIGGSQGADDLNQDVIAIVGRLMQKHENLGLIHIVGEAHVEKSMQEYKDELLADELKRVVVKGFVSDVFRYMGAADLVVTRASATIVAELALQGQAVVVVPGRLAGGHQLKNAQALDKDKRAVMVAHADREGLYGELERLLSYPLEREKLAKRLHELAKPEASKELAELALKSFGTEV